MTDYYCRRFLSALQILSLATKVAPIKHTHTHILFQLQIVGKTPSSPTLSTTHEGCLFQGLRVPPGLSVSVSHDPYCVYPCNVLFL